MFLLLNAYYFFLKEILAFETEKNWNQVGLKPTSCLDFLYKGIICI